MSNNFENVVQIIRNLPKNKDVLSNTEKLVMYGLFKQSTLGDCNTERPGGIFNQTAKYKWDYWNKFKGKSKEWAKTNYVAYYNKLKKKYDMK